MICKGRGFVTRALKVMGFLPSSLSPSWRHLFGLHTIPQVGSGIASRISDGTSQTGEATAGFVQRPAIPPRSRRVTSRSPPEIAAEYRAIVRPPRTGEDQG